MSHTPPPGLRIAPIMLCWEEKLPRGVHMWLGDTPEWQGPRNTMLMCWSLRVPHRLSRVCGWAGTTTLCHRLNSWPAGGGLVGRPVKSTPGMFSPRPMGSK